MPWDSVPWFIEGSAEHSAQIARLLAYNSVGGAEGVIGPTDLCVRALSSPGQQVEVLTGACSILNRAAGAQYEAYAGRMISTDRIPITPTGPTGRSDLIIARVENPYLMGETWPQPSTPATGPYIATRVISGVPANTTTARQARPGDSAIALARIDLPPNTTSVLPAHIKDLRRVTRPRTEERVYTVIGCAYSYIEPTDGNPKNWPEQAAWSIDIPEWAVTAIITTNLSGLRLSGDNVYAQMHHVLAGIAGSNSELDDDGGTGFRRADKLLVDRFAIPAALRGTTKPLNIQTTAIDPGRIDVNSSTQLICRVQFQEAAAQDGA
ncbi:hypothetical protein [Streptomyces sp. MJM8645]|uniref:hypothetical protein n=1 Tax=Streptomycetaceae TaxID=2062 RepID=UPI0007AEF184|nr:hypothetical protein [Streptomyces sp. MJM8645]